MSCRCGYERRGRDLAFAQGRSPEVESEENWFLDTQSAAGPEREALEAFSLVRSAWGESNAAIPCSKA